MNARLRAAMREPLVHFVVLGGLVFALGHFAGRDSKPQDPRSIEVTPEIRARLAAAEGGAEAPDAAELSRRIDAWVDEEILYREAIRLGLDRDDPVIRRRLVQKMEFIGQSGEPLAEPTDAELQAFLQEHAARYAGAPRYDFVQLVVAHADDPDGDDARAALQALRAGAAPQELGRVGTSRRFSLDNVAGTFGPELAAALPSLPRGEWHLVELPAARAIVRVDVVEQGDVPPLARVRNRVLIDWRKARAQEGVRRGLEELRRQYRVEVVP